jgi:predicted lipid-binding transport protein (Tim44 family)
MDAPPRLALLLVSATVGLTACGASNKDSAKDFQGEQRRVAQAVEDLQKAASKRDRAKICNELLAPALVDQISKASKNSCDEALKDPLADADSFELEVQRVTIDGDKATAVVKSDAKGDHDRVDTLQLQKFGNAWKIATLGTNTAQG